METGDERVITLDWMARFEYFLWLNRLVFNPGGSLIHCNIRQGALFCQCELFILQAHISQHILLNTSDNTQQKFVLVNPVAEETIFI